MSESLLTLLCVTLAFAILEGMVYLMTSSRQSFREKSMALKILSKKLDPETAAAKLNAFVTSRPAIAFSGVSVLQQLLCLPGTSLGRFTVLLTRQLRDDSFLLCAKEDSQEYTYDENENLIETRVVKYYNYCIFLDSKVQQYIINGTLNVSRYDEQIQKELAELIFDRLAAESKTT